MRLVKYTIKFKFKIQGILIFKSFKVTINIKTSRQIHLIFVT